MSERQQPQLSRRDARRQYNLQTYGTNIPNVEEKRAIEAAQPSAAKKLAALEAGYTPPTAAATGDLLKRRLELFKSMEGMGREKAAELAGEAEGLQISKSGFRQALNRIPLTPATTATTPATTPATTATTPAATRPAAPEPISKIGGVPASEALAALRGRSAEVPFTPTSAERFTASQVSNLAAGKAGIAGSEPAPPTFPPLLQRPPTTTIPTALRPVAAIPSAQQLMTEALARIKARESAPAVTAATPAATPVPTVSSMAPRTKTVSTLMPKPTLPETAGMPARASGSTPSASFTPPTTGEGLSEAENFARLKQSGYTTKQAAALLGLKDKKAPAWMEDSAAAKVYNFLNRY